MNKIINKLRTIIDSILIFLFRFLPVKSNYIVLESEGDYTDNIKVFYDYLLSKNINKEYKLIWFVHEPSSYQKIENVYFISRFNKIFNFRAMYYSARAKYFIFSHPYWLKNWKSNQIVIYTTHSVAQLKGKGSTLTYKLVDYILCCSEYCQDQTAYVLNVNRDIVIPIGMPRIDLMYQKKNCIPLLIDKYENQKIILCMETFKQTSGWKDSSVVNKYGINIIESKEELINVNQYLKEHNEILIVKLHHLQDTSYFENMILSNIYYIFDSQLKSHNLQTNDLLVNADILLTDYSSVFYEFLLTDRQIGFLLGDFEDYSRGFLMDDPLSEMPGEKITSVQELFDFFDDFENGIDRYKEDRQRIKEKVFRYDDNQNCERLYNWLINLKKE